MLKWATYFSLLLLFSSCANIVAPTGGPKDKEAPKILANPIDSSLNFKGGNIAIEFDEYIKLQNIQKQIQITPLLKTNPKISVKKKSLVLELPDSILSDNTTYHIQFGNSIKDLREGNVYKDLNITFSTGKYFDSLQCSGTILQAESGLRDTGISIYLYPDNIADSNLLKIKPMYVSKVQNGRFAFNALPQKNFKIVALNDQNDNYLYDALGERVAFFTKKINPLSDNNIILYSFLEENKRDTTTNKLGKKRVATKTKSDSIRYSIVPTINPKTKFHILDTLFIKLQDSITKVDKNKIRLYENASLDLTTPIFYNEEKNEIAITPKWSLDAAYKLILINGFASDSNRISKKDTIRFSTMAAQDYGNIIVKIEDSLLQENNIISLWVKGKKIREENVKNNSTTFKLLKPGKYTLQLLYDTNDNGRWDSGSFYKKEAPEKSIALPKSIVVKPNWDKEVLWEKNSKKRKRLRE